MNIVHIRRWDVLNTGITSKEAILQVSRDIVACKGLSALNMRAVADKCHFALGTLYNHYANKDELLLATVEDIWKDIFHMNQRCPIEMTFPRYVAYIFECIQKGAEKYHNFFSTHAVSIASSGKEKAKCTRNLCFEHIKEGLLEVLQADNNVSENAFDTSFEKREFIEFVFDNILLLLVQGKKTVRCLSKSYKEQFIKRSPSSGGFSFKKL